MMQAKRAPFRSLVEALEELARRRRAKEPAVQGIRNEHPEPNDAMERDDASDDDGSSHDDQEAREGVSVRKPRLPNMARAADGALQGSAIRPREADTAVSRPQ